MTNLNLFIVFSIKNAYIIKMVKVIIFFIRLYQIFISPIIGGFYKCRFYPRCSDYSVEVYKNFGIFKGTILTIKRIIKCNPFCKGGVDLPPKK